MPYFVLLYLCTFVLTLPALLLNQGPNHLAHTHIHINIPIKTAYDIIIIMTNIDYPLLIIVDRHTIIIGTAAGRAGTFLSRKHSPLPLDTATIGHTVRRREEEEETPLATTDQPNPSIYTILVLNRFFSAFQLLLHHNNHMTTPHFFAATSPLHPKYAKNHIEGFSK